MRLVAAWICVVASACGADRAEAPDLGPRPEPSRSQVRIAPATDAINPRLLRRFKPIEPFAADASDAGRLRVQLGKQLFFDKRLSQRRDTACVTCHPLDRGGTDGLAKSRGSHGAFGKRNASTVFNAAWHVAQFWDGRAHSSEEQARMPLLDPDEMGNQTPETITAVLRGIPGYATALTAAFPGDKSPVDFEHAVTAIVAFERTLITPSRWDRYLRGEPSALTTVELDGLKLFADVGCVQCHTGMLLGGSMFQRAGVAHSWPDQTDQGRFEITHDANDRMVFKVPSLRNIALTSPYFHDGSTASLSDAVRIMAKYQLDADLSPAEIASIVAWLNTLTGVPAPDAVTRPELPVDR
jgi:cytochrome c peroxidase